MPTRFELNPLFEKEAALTPEMQAYLVARAEEAAAATKNIAEASFVDDVPHKFSSGFEEAPGAYVRGIEVYSEPGLARVNAHDFKSVWIEFGTGQPGPTPEFAPLRKGAESVGLRPLGGKRTGLFTGRRGR